MGSRYNHQLESPSEETQSLTRNENAFYPGVYFTTINFITVQVSDSSLSQTIFCKAVEVVEREASRAG